MNIIHIAGTKGKGSTCAFTESFLRAHGTRTGFPRKTGLYTSPHLFVPEERIRINSSPLSQAQFAEYFFELYDRLPQLALEYHASKDVLERGPRYLQLFVLFAFHVFVREKVDVAIFETHNGGEYDATNVIQTPIVTAVTTLGMDHIDMLGPTIEDIAWHKSGIFKHGAVALSAMQDEAPAKVLRRRSMEKGGEVRFVHLDDRLPAHSVKLEPHVQRKNASLAAAIADAFLQKRGLGSRRQLAMGDVISGVELFNWPGRFQTILEGRCSWFLDAAHNEMSIEIAAEWFASVVGQVRRCDRPQPLPNTTLGSNDSEGASEPTLILIFSHVNALRDTGALLGTLAKAISQHAVKIDYVIFTTYAESRDTKDRHAATDVELLYETWHAINPHSETLFKPTIQGALQLVRKLGGNNMQTLITGSQKLVGPALHVLQKDQKNA